MPKQTEAHIMANNPLSPFLCAASALLLSASMGMNAILLPVSMEALGFDTGRIGIILSAEIIATLCICFSISTLLKYISMRKTIILSAFIHVPSLFFLGILANTSPNSPWASWEIWLIIVFTHGIGISTMLLMSQTWLNSLPIRHNKGLVMAIFGVSISGGFAIGPFLIEYGSVISPFLVGIFGNIGENEAYLGAFMISVLISAASVFPILFAKSVATKQDSSSNILSVVRRAPALMWAIAMVGATYYGITSFITIYGIRNGLSLYESSLLLSSFMIGCIVLELPAAWLSEKIDRRFVVMIAVVWGMACAAYLPIAIESRWVWALLFLWGGMNAAIYSVVLTIIGERFSANEQVSANAAYTTMDAVGGTLGVMMIGFSMSYIGLDGLPYAIMFSCLVYFSYALTRYRFT